MPRLSTILIVLLAVAGARAQAPEDELLFQPGGAIRLLLFLTSDCPISNAFAPEIQRICAGYRERGVACTLVYEDVGLTTDAVGRHLQEYRYEGLRTHIDASRAVARRAGATVTPEAVVVDRDGAVRYRGRINDFYAALGTPRRRVTSHDLRDALDALLAGRPVATPVTQAVGCFIVTPPTVRTP